MLRRLRLQRPWCVVRTSRSLPCVRGLGGGRESALILGVRALSRVVSDHRQGGYPVSSHSLQPLSSALGRGSGEFWPRQPGSPGNTCKCAGCCGRGGGFRPGRRDRIVTCRALRRGCCGTVRRRGGICSRTIHSRDGSLQGWVRSLAGRVSPGLSRVTRASIHFSTAPRALGAMSLHKVSL